MRYLNASDYLLDGGRDADVAVVETSGTHTYRDLREAAGRVAAALAALHLPLGSRVAIMGPNSFFWVASYLAAMKMGHVAVPMATVLTADDVRRNADFVETSAALADRRSARRLADSLPPGTAVITDEVLRGDSTPLWPQTSTDPDSDAVLMFTSGTTARPRAVRVTHRNICANTDSIVQYLQLVRDDRMLVILPFFYCYGASLLHTHLRVGGSVALCNTFTFPETAVDMMEQHSCTGFAGVPSSIQLLLRISTFASRELPALRLVQQAGGKLAPAQLHELARAKPDADVFVMYGQTEATARLSYLPPELLADKVGSIGRGIPGVQLTVVDEHGEAVAPGEVGEIIARGDNVSPGYYRNPEASAEKFKDHTLHTGDLATVDDDGFIYVVDRKSDFIKTWGYRVSSHEVEAAALELVDLVSAAAIGAPDPEAGEAVVLFASTRPDAEVTEAEVVDHLRRRLAKHMVPERVVLMDSLPVNSSGKVAKGRLRTMAAAGAS